MGVISHLVRDRVSRILPHSATQSSVRKASKNMKLFIFITLLSLALAKTIPEKAEISEKEDAIPEAKGDEKIEDPISEDKEIKKVEDPIPEAKEDKKIEDPIPEAKEDEKKEDPIPEDIGDEKTEDAIAEVKKEIAKLENLIPEAKEDEKIEDLIPEAKEDGKLGAAGAIPDAIQMLLKEIPDAENLIRDLGKEEDPRKGRRRPITPSFSSRKQSKQEVLKRLIQAIKKFVKAMRSALVKEEKIDREIYAFLRDVLRIAQRRAIRIARIMILSKGK